MSDVFTEASNRSFRGLDGMRTAFLVGLKRFRRFLRTVLVVSFLGLRYGFSGESSFCGLQKWGCR